jgi:hypothetical protein
MVVPLLIRSPWAPGIHSAGLRSAVKARQIQFVAIRLGQLALSGSGQAGAVIGLGSVGEELRGLSVGFVRGTATLTNIKSRRQSYSRELSARGAAFIEGAFSGF